MIAFGSGPYGKTYRVPGVLHVTTRFLHVSFFPFVPRSSWVVLHKNVRSGPEGKGYELPSLQWRSVWLAWLRASLFVAGLVTGLVLTTQVLLDRPPAVLALTATVLTAVGLGYWCSYRLDRPDFVRLVTVLKGARLPADLVAHVERAAGR
jgi:hypothetical protein